MPDKESWERRIEIIDARLNRISAGQDRRELRLAAMKELVQRNAEAQLDTDKRLNALIKVVDDLVRQRPPGAD